MVTFHLVCLAHKGVHALIKLREVVLTVRGGVASVATGEDTIGDEARGKRAALIYRYGRYTTEVRRNSLHVNIQT